MYATHACGLLREGIHAHLYPVHREHLCAHEHGECWEHGGHVEVLLAGLEGIEQALGIFNHILHGIGLRACHEARDIDNSS